jgi:hypothetical protein
MVTSAHRVEVEVGADGRASERTPLRGRRRCAAGGRQLRTPIANTYRWRARTPLESIVQMCPLVALRRDMLTTPFGVATDPLTGES